MFGGIMKSSGKLLSLVALCLIGIISISFIISGVYIFFLDSDQIHLKLTYNGVRLVGGCCIIAGLVILLAIIIGYKKKAL